MKERIKRIAKNNSIRIKNSDVDEIAPIFQGIVNAMHHAVDVGNVGDVVVSLPENISAMSDFLTILSTSSYLFYPADVDLELMSEDYFEVLQNHPSYIVLAYKEKAKTMLYGCHFFNGPVEYIALDVDWTAWHKFLFRKKNNSQYKLLKYMLEDEFPYKFILKKCPIGLTIGAIGFIPSTKFFTTLPNITTQQ